MSEYELPSHCVACGLGTGATQHEPDCPWNKLIEDFKKGIVDESEGPDAESPEQGVSE